MCVSFIVPQFLKAENFFHRSSVVPPGWTLASNGAKQYKALVAYQAKQGTELETLGSLPPDLPISDRHGTQFSRLWKCYLNL